MYRRKAATEVSWYQPQAALSLDLIRRTTPDLDAPIIDVGGGASTLVDGLIDAGYRAVTVLDIASEALAVAQQRLGERATKVRCRLLDSMRETHHTPSGSEQSFTYCLCRVEAESGRL